MFNSRRAVDELGMVFSKFSMVDTRGRRAEAAPKSKLPKCGAMEGRVGKGGRGVEGGGLAPRMVRRGLHIAG